MWLSEQYRYLTLIALVFSGSASGEGYVLGFGAEFDTAGGRAASMFGDYGVGENTWLSAAAATTQAGGFIDLETVYADVGIDHWFDPVGIRISGAYWGDDDLLDSVDARAAVYIRNDTGSVTLDYERRFFDFTFDSIISDERRTTEFHADGYGLAARLKTSERASVFLRGMSYQYSRDISLQESIDVLRFFSTSRLSLMNSLIDYRVSGGLEWNFGLRLVDIRLEQWQTAVDKGRVNSIGIGMLTPVSAASDMEFRFAYDESDNFGSTVAFSVYLYYFGI